MLPTLSTTALLLSCLGLGAQAALDGHCPPLGAVLPPPTRPSTHKAIPSAAAKLRAILDQMSATYNNSAVSIGVKSIHEDDLMFEYAHTPANKEKRGAQTIDSDTVFRLGSLTKVFPVLALLKLHDQGVRLDDPITKYVPELRGLKNEGREDNSIWDTQWDDVTLGALASHMSGTASDCKCMLAVSPRSQLTQDSDHGHRALWRPRCLWLSEGERIQLPRLLWLLRDAFVQQDE
jgi:CubicO group peptidase (beta-lactamase class C family)